MFKRLTSRRVTWGAIYVYVALVVLHLFYHYSGMNAFYRSRMNDMVMGTAYRPYQNRALVPIVIGILNQETPAPVQSAIKSVLTSNAFDPDFYFQIYSYINVLFQVVGFVCFFAMALGGRKIYALLYGGGLTANLVGLIYILLVPTWFRYYNYVYDPATLALSTWLAYVVLTNDLLAFVILFILASINKETSVIYLPVLATAAVLYKRKLWPVAVTCVILLGVWEFLRQAIQQHYAANPGFDLENHWLEHQAVVLSKYPMSLVYAICAFLFFGYLIGYGWRAKPLMIRAGFLWTFVPLFVSSIFFGFIDETRALYDCYPFALMLAIPPILQWARGIPILQPRPTPAT